MTQRYCSNKTRQDKILKIDEKFDDTRAKIKVVAELKRKRGTLSLPTLRDGILPKEIGLEDVRHFFVGLEVSRHSLLEGWNFADTEIDQGEAI